MPLSGYKREIPFIEEHIYSSIKKKWTHTTETDTKTNEVEVSISMHVN